MRPCRLRSQPATEYMLGWVLERKSCGDLLSSIQVRMNSVHAHCESLRPYSRP